MSSHQMTRRTFAATSAGFAAGVFAPFHAASARQDATAVNEIQPLGFVSTRVRTVDTPEQLALVNELVLSDFAAEVEALEGVAGYLVGDVVDQETVSVSILVMDEAARAEAFTELASDFIAGIEDRVEILDTEEWSGDLLVCGIADVTDETANPTPTAEPGSGFVTVRLQRTVPNVDLGTLAQREAAEFLPIVAALPGYRSYLWYPIDDGFVAISLFDSEDSGMAATDAAFDWFMEELAVDLNGFPTVIHANPVYASLPISRAGA